MNVGTLSIDNFNAVFDVLQTVGKTNMVSSPKIATIENQEAKILVGTKEAYVTTTVSTPGTGVSTTAESVTFIDVGIKLFVTPTVGDDGFITMKIRPEVSSVDRLLQTSQGNSIPIVRTSESETTVMVKDGITIVIGGLIEERDEKSTSGIPLLCKIPFIGPLFGKTSIEKTRTELAVFLTPRVMTGDVTNVTPFDQKTYKPK
jgi:general secretion pathway protein D